MPRTAKTPREYEEYVAAFIGRMDGFRNAVIHRNRNYDGVRQPGKYEVDIALHLSIGAVDLFVIVECKQWGRPVDRPAVQKLAQTRDAIAAHKAIITSPVGFTAEAVEVAKALGIAVWVLAETGFTVAHAAPPPDGAGSWHPEVDLYCSLRAGFVQALLPGAGAAAANPYGGGLVLADLASLDESSPNFSVWEEHDVEEGDFVLKAFAGTFYPRGSAMAGVDAVTAEYALAQWIRGALVNGVPRERDALYTALKQWCADALARLVTHGLTEDGAWAARAAVEDGDPQTFYLALKGRD